MPRKINSRRKTKRKKCMKGGANLVDMSEGYFISLINDKFEEMKRNLIAAITDTMRGITRDTSQRARAPAPARAAGTGVEPVMRNTGARGTVLVNGFSIPALASDDKVRVVMPEVIPQTIPVNIEDIQRLAAIPDNDERAVGTIKALNQTGDTYDFVSDTYNVLFDAPIGHGDSGPKIHKISPEYLRFVPSGGRPSR